MKIKLYFFLVDEHWTFRPRQRKYKIMADSLDEALKKVVLGERGKPIDVKRLRKEGNGIYIMSDAYTIIFIGKASKEDFEVGT